MTDLHNGNPYTGELVSAYQIGPEVFLFYLGFNLWNISTIYDSILLQWSS